MKDKYTEKQKLAYKLNKELREIWDAQRALGFYKLPSPVRKGWQRQFCIREDVLRTRDADRYKLILPYIQETQVSKTTHFPEYKDRDFRIKTIRDIDKDKCGFPEFFWTKYFYESQDYNRGYATGVEFKYPNCYHFAQVRVLKEEIVPHFIKELRIIDPRLESREREIQNKIKSNKLRGAINKIDGCRSRTGWEVLDHERENLKIRREMEKEIWDDLNDKNNDKE